MTHCISTPLIGNKKEKIWWPLHIEKFRELYFFQRAAAQSIPASFQLTADFMQASFIKRIQDR